jgi:hypothetical protein
LAAANGPPAFPNFDVTVNHLLQTNLIFPVPREFISPKLRKCAVIRPTSPGQLDALGAINGFVGDGLFNGQPQKFINLLRSMAREADETSRTLL